MRNISFIVFLLFLFSFPNLYSYKNQEAIDIITLVDEASKLIEEKGETVFSDFSDIKSKWLNKKCFINIYDLNGVCIVNPPLDDCNISNDASETEKFKKMFVFENTYYDYSNSHWVYTSCKNLKNLNQNYKIIYSKKVKTPAGKEYIVASGRFNLKLEPEFVVDEVEKIVHLIKEKGNLAFSMIRNRTHDFFCAENFLFILDNMGNVLFNSAKFSPQQINILNLNDFTGAPYIKNLINLSLSKNSGWMNYYEEKNDEKNAYLKSIYYQTAVLNDKKVIVAYSVIFPDAISINAKNKSSQIYEIKYLSDEYTDFLAENTIDSFKELTKNVNNIFLIEVKTGILVIDKVIHGFEQKNINYMKDLFGQPMFKNMLVTLDFNNNKGWVHYIKNSSSQNKLFPTWKSAYITRFKNNNIEYILGVVGVNLEMHPEFANETLDIAYNFLSESTDINSAISTIREHNLFFYKNLRFFITEGNGVQLFDSKNTFFENLNILKFKDASGDFIVKKYLKLAEENKNETLSLVYTHVEPGSNLKIYKTLYFKSLTLKDKSYVIGVDYKTSQKPK